VRQILETTQRFDLTKGITKNACSLKTHHATCVMADLATIKKLSAAGRHQECLQACQQLLQSEPKNPFVWKYAGKSLLALGQV